MLLEAPHRRQPQRRRFGWIDETHGGPGRRRARTRVAAAAALAVAVALVALPQSGDAWWHGRTLGPRVPAGYAWGPGPAVLFPFQRPYPEYRYSTPPGAPLSFDDPDSGTTYCWSQTTGFYFVCAYERQAAVSPETLLPPPPGLGPPPPRPTTAPASGVLLFRLPHDAQAAIDGVPVGLSDGLGIYALSPGTYRVALRVSGQETVHQVNIRPHKIFTVTPSGVLATEP